MSLIELRRILVTVEEIFHENGPVASKPHRRGAVCAVLKNPYAGRYEPDIMPMMLALEPVGADMARRLVKAMKVQPHEIEAYGKGAIIGAAGELEHGALWHAPGGYGMRAVLGGTKAIVPSTKKVGGPGTRLDVPIGHKDAAYVRSHFDAIEVGVPGAPHADEIVLVLVMTTGPRVHSRAGGLKASAIKGEDGLR